MNRGRIKVLVVDDMSSMRLMIKAVLREMGIVEMREAGDGEKGRELMQGNRFDLVICDWDMPRMSGLELLQAVRADDALKRMPFIMLTANANRRHVMQAIEAGVSDYLAKPFKPSDLIAKIDRVLG